MVKINKIIKMFLFETSLYVSLQSALYVIIASLFFLIPIDLVLVLLVFLNTFSIYTINKYTDINEDKINNPERYNFFIKNKRIITILALLSFLISFLISLFYDLFIIFLTLLPLLLGILYSIKIIPSSKGGIRKSLKDIFLVKNFIISLTWATRILYITPVIGFNLQLIGLFFFVFILESIANIAFDVRDVEGDKLADVKTLPTRLGVPKTIKILILLDLFLLIFGLFLFVYSIFSFKIMILSFSMFFYFLFCINLITKNTNKTVTYDFFIDSITLIILFLTLIIYMLNL